MKTTVSTVLCLMLLFMGISGQIFADDGNAYLAVTGPCNLEFPKDHGAHPGYRTEWWYYTGNLRAENGNQYGFQLTFFRSQISPPGAEKQWPRPPSAWRTQQVYVAHAAVSNIASRHHRYAEEGSRAALGLAGVDQLSRQTTVFLKNWSTRIKPDLHVLTASTADFSYKLNLIPAKAAVLHGVNGYNLRGSTPERASCYYSFTRLRVKGRITLDGKSVAVTGLAWMDHEFSTAPIEPGITGWDWFGLQLSDNTEVMVKLGRTNRGRLHPASGGTYINADGVTRRLTNHDIEVKVLGTWKSKKSGARYPARWHLKIVPVSLDVKINSNLPDQEMRTSGSTGVTYWEGSVSLEGFKDKLPVKGQGYVELTGYAAAFDAPL